MEWLIRVAAQKHTLGCPPQSNPSVKSKARDIADQLEKKFQMQINRPNIGGSGSSNNGNMARRLLADPATFASILNVDKALIENIRLISSLALSSKLLDADRVQELIGEIEKQLSSEFPYVKKLPPSVHKYAHLPEYIRSLVIYFMRII